MENLFEEQLFEAIGKMKKKARKNVYDTLNNINIGKSIKTFAIMTAENPKGDKPIVADNKNKEKLERAENEIRMSELKRLLRQKRILFVTQKGVYRTPKNPDGVENSLILINIQFELVKSLSLKFQQESFIYCECKDNKITSYYYQTEDFEQYKLLEKITKPIKNIEDADNFYSMYTFNHKHIKYTIPFLFEDIADFIADSMYVSLNEYDLSLKEKDIEKASFSNIGSSWYRSNNIMYKAIQENIKRYLSEE